MAKSRRVTIPINGVATRVDAGSADSGSYGERYVVHNSGTVAIELGGPDIDGTNSWRGLAAGAQVPLVLDANEELWARNPSGTTAGSVDVLETS